MTARESHEKRQAAGELLFPAHVVEQIPAQHAATLLGVPATVFLGSAVNFQSSSLFFMPADHPVRRFAIAVTLNVYFRAAVFFWILLNTVVMTIRERVQSEGGNTYVLDVMDDITICVFVVEMVIKIVAFGLVCHRHAYLRDPWNVVDAIVVMSAVADQLDVAADSAFSGAFALVAFRVLRILRPLRTMSGFSSMREIITRILSCLTLVGKVALMLVVLMWLVAAVGLLSMRTALDGRCFADVTPAVSMISQWASNCSQDASSPLEVVLIPVGAPPSLPRYVAPLADTRPCGLNTGIGRACPAFVDVRFSCPDRTWWSPTLMPNATSWNQGMLSFAVSCMSKRVVDDPTWPETLLDFSNMYHAMLVSFKLACKDNWPDQYRALADGAGVAQAFFFTFGATLLVGYFCVNFFTAVFESSFSTIEMASMDVEVARRHEAASADRDETGLSAKVTFATVLGASAIGNAATFVCCFSPDDGMNANDPTFYDLNAHRLGQLLTSAAVAQVEYAALQHYYDREDQRGRRVGLEAPLLAAAVPSHQGTTKPTFLVSTPHATLFGRFRKRCGVTWRKVLRVSGVPRVRVVVLSVQYNLFTLMCVFVNVVALATITSDSTQHHVTTVQWISFAFGIVFIVDAALKLTGLGASYFQSSLNCLDFVLTVCSLPEVISLGDSKFSALRALRVVRLMRLGRRWRSLRKLLQLVGDSLGKVLSVSIVGFIVMLCFTLLGYELFAGYTLHSSLQFSSVGQSFLTVFISVTGEDQNDMYNDLSRQGRTFAPLFFVALTLFGNFIWANLFTSVILDSFAGFAEQEFEEQKTKAAGLSADTLGLDGGVAWNPEKWIDKLLDRQVDELMRVVSTRIGNPIANLLAPIIPKAVAPAEAPTRLHQYTADRPSLHDDVVMDVSMATVRSREDDNGSGQTLSCAIAMGQSMLIESESSVVQYDEYGDDAAMRRHTEEDDADTSFSIAASRIVGRQKNTSARASVVIPPIGSTVGDDIVLRDGAATIGCMQLDRDDTMPTGGNSITEGKDSLKAPKRSGRHPSRDRGGSRVNALYRSAGSSVSLTEMHILLKDWGGLQFPSLWLRLPPSHRFRTLCVRIIQHTAFDWASLFLTLASSVLLALDRPEAETGTLKSIIVVSDVLFCVLFASECVIKMVALGFVRHKGAFLRSPWNCVDALQVICSIAALFFSPLKFVRSLRIVRIFNVSFTLRVVTRSLISAIPQMGTVVVFFALLNVMWSIVGLELYRSKFNVCTDATIFTEVACVGDFEVPHLSPFNGWQNSTASVVERVWRPSDPSTSSFNSFYQAMYTLFKMSCTDGWFNIMYTAMNAHGTSSFVAAAFFVSYMIVGKFFAVQLFVGVLVDRFVLQRQRGEGYALLSESQAQWVLIQKVLLRSDMKLKVPRPTGQRLRAFAYDIVNHVLFDYASLAMNTINAIAVSLYGTVSASSEFVLDDLGIALLAFMLLEIALRLTAMGPRGYVQRKQNLLDLAIIGGSTIAVLINADSSSVLERVFRGLRLLTFLRRIPGIKFILSVFFQAIPELANVTVLLASIFFVYAVVGVQLFYAADRTNPSSAISRSVNFRDVWHAMASLYIMMTEEGWSEITDGLAGVSHAAFPYAISFMILGSWIGSHLMVTVVIDVFVETEETITIGDSIRVLDTFRQRWMSYDLEGTRLLQSTTVIQRILPYLSAQVWDSSTAVSTAVQSQFLSRHRSSLHSHGSGSLCSTVSLPPSVKRTPFLVILYQLQRMHLPIDKDKKCRYEDCLASVAMRLFSLQVAEALIASQRAVHGVVWRSDEYCAHHEFAAVLLTRVVRRWLARLRLQKDGSLPVTMACE